MPSRKVLTVAIVASLRADQRDPHGPGADELVDQAIEDGEIPERPVH